MKILKLVGSPLIKFCKGLFVVYALMFLTMVIVQSCKKSEVTKNDGASVRMLNALKKQSQAIRSVPVQFYAGDRQLGSSSENRLESGPLSSNSLEQYNPNEQIAYITFDQMPINPDFSYDINGMTHLINHYNGVLTYQPSDNSYSFNVPLEEVNNTLNPLVSEARAYLNARGLTDTDIDIMIQEEGAQEVDLVPFAATLAEYESSGAGGIGMNYLNLFVPSAQAGDVLHCAMVALGVDALWALGGSNASAWTKSAMKTAFKAVAKRALGPIGVMIAVTSFGLCLGDWLP